MENNNRSSPSPPPPVAAAATTTPRYLVRHCDSQSTGEGLGSHARGTLFPLLRLSLRFRWQILWQHQQSLCWSHNETRPSYNQECRNLGTWWGFATEQDYQRLDPNHTIVVPIDLEVDPRLGRICGLVGVLIEAIQEYWQQHGEDVFYCRYRTSNTTTKQQQQRQQQQETIIISLHGRFQYQDDPTLPAIGWMQAKARTWKKDSYPTDKVQIVAHVRIPEDYCSQEWKDANTVHHAIQTLQLLHQQLLSLHEEGMTEESEDANRLSFSIDVYTEQSFSLASETLLRQQILHSMPLFSSADSVLEIHRQTPLLPCIEAMATATIFIPASSFLSSLAAYFQTSLIVLPNEPTRHQKYFAPHLQHAAEIQTVDDTAVTERQRQQLGKDDGLARKVACPIVRVEEEATLRRALQRLLRDTRKSSP